MVDFARAAKINRVLGYLPGCIGAPSTRTEPCGKVDECLQCWFRKQMTLTSAQPPSVPLPAVQGQLARGPMVRQTRTYAELAVSAACFAEIGSKLRAAGYDHAFLGGGADGAVTIDMHGIGLVVETQ